MLEIFYTRLDALEKLKCEIQRLAPIFVKSVIIPEEYRKTPDVARAITDLNGTCTDVF